MFTRISLAAVALVALAVVPAPAQPPAKDVFASPTAVWQLHLDFTAKEFAAMNPPVGVIPGFAAPKKPADREVHRNVFGVDLPWAFAGFTADGQAFAKVGVRYKGNGTFMDAMRAAKKSFKIDLDKYDEMARFHGRKSLNLHSGITDPSKARETLAYAAYRAAGVPAPRTTLAELTVTVPGRFEKEYFGLYTVVESIDKPFLKRHFKTDKGLLMKPERIRGLDYLGENWEPYKQNYQPKRDATDAEKARLVAFTKLVNRGTDDEFRAGIADHLDVPAFLRYMAATAMTSNLDSFFTLGHNYYLYLHPDTNKFHFLPWDLDRSMGNFGVFGSMDQQMDLSITKPYGGANRLADRVMGVKELADEYRTVLKDVAGKAFTKEKLTADLEAFEKATKDIVAKDAKAAAARKDGPAGFYGAVPDMRTFVTKRAESIAAQLAGERKGYTPGGFGFGAPPPPPQPQAQPFGQPPARAGEIFLPPPMRAALGLTDEQQKQLAELQKEIDAKLDKLLTDEQRERLRRMKQATAPKKP